jgi:membrane-associated protease RseP (regulator of RpoE activity)
MIAAGEPASPPNLETFEQAIRAQPGTLPPGPSVDIAQPAPAAAAAPAYLGAILDDRADRGRGVRVVDIRAGTPAEKAGLLRGDLVTSIDGVRVREMRNLADILAVHKPGDTVAIDVVRGNETVQISAVLSTRPAAADQPPAAAPEPMPGPTIVAPAAPLAPVVPPTDGPALLLPAVPPSVEPVPATTLVDQLRQRVEQLERRVAELEKALAAQRN